MKRRKKTLFGQGGGAVEKAGDDQRRKRRGFLGSGRSPGKRNSYESGPEKERDGKGAKRVRRARWWPPGKTTSHEKRELTKMESRRQFQGKKKKIAEAKSKKKRKKKHDPCKIGEGAKAGRNEKKKGRPSEALCWRVIGKKNKNRGCILMGVERSKP